MPGRDLVLLGGADTPRLVSLEISPEVCSAHARLSFRSAELSLCGCLGSTRTRRGPPAKDANHGQYAATRALSASLSYINRRRPTVVLPSLNPAVCDVGPGTLGATRVDTADILDVWRERLRRRAGDLRRKVGQMERRHLTAFDEPGSRPLARGHADGRTLRPQRERPQMHPLTLA